MSGGEGLAIVAGTGTLPRLLADECVRLGRDYTIIKFPDVDLAWTSGHPIIPAEFEKPGRLFSDMHRVGCTEVVFAGGMRRPKLNPLRFDLKMLRILPKVLAGLRSGDDAALRLAAGIFEAEGFRLVAAQQLLADLVSPAGVLTFTSPSEADLQDIERARAIVSALGAVDVGQAAVVAQGICLGLETIQGTDRLLNFVAVGGEEFRPDPNGAKGVLFKAPKPGQDRRMDLPTVGPQTIRNAMDAGLAGIAVEADGALMLDLPQMLRIANDAGFFIYGVEKS